MKKTPVYSSANGNYFYNIEEIQDYCSENDLKITDLRLLLCERCNSPEIYEDYFSSDLPEDVELPENILLAIEEFNHIVEANWVISWQPTLIAVNIETSTDL